ncbi:DUF5597 domain-containing protein [Alteraurantiacibacter buctensis]|uniref:Beta-galactosidase n=1 Tax=Alteraurantiacibacter buctensis TaxID=1503981 RepID=A0A844YTF4_9SPHN|nr:DUF5597 domain-containing protein [Alteraurantiacibacter buctensis]MXO70118.1 beta-galactosidase [Alteraurantiacibacter buctensis]
MGRILACWLALVLLLAGPAAPAQVPPLTPLPRIVDGPQRPMLLVDGQPFIALAVQAHNSSGYPAVLPQVWPVARQLGANTVMLPVGWEQVEPVEGRFDFGAVDAMLAGARENDLRLVLLWYGTWKNTGLSYTPAWVKRDGLRFPRMRHPDGRAHETLSPHGEQTLAADARAFAALMRHLRQADPQRTVIMVQVENEAGSWGLARDHSAHAQALFADLIPQELARALAVPRRTWEQAFGPRAEQFFMSWHVARYIEHVARAGQAELDLPMIANAALGNAFTDEGGEVGPSGGPNWNVLPVWRAAAPSLGAIGPDIYTRDAAAVERFLDRYAAHGPLVVPEIGNAAEYARFAWSAFGRGALLYAPFGMDGTAYVNYPLGAKALDEGVLGAFAAPYRLLGSAMSGWPLIAGERPLWGTARGNDGSDQSTTMGRWRLTAAYGRWAFGEDDWTWIPRDPHPLADVPTGGLVAAQLDADTFLVGGQNVRLRLSLANPAPGESPQVIEAQEGTFIDGQWVMRRRWNGDQIDYGFSFGPEPVWLRITMDSYR